MPEEPSDNAPGPRLMNRIVTSPWFGGIAGLAGIAALLTGIYFYYASKTYRSLTFYVPPIKSVIVSGGQLSDLEVFFHKKQVQDVTIAQMAIWNKGNEAIRKEDALDQVKIVLRPMKPILKASVIKVSRQVVGFTCDESQLEKGSIPVSWNILEQDDGAIVQVVYASSADVQLDLVGDIEGQKKIVKLQYAGKILSPSEQIRKGYRETILLGVTILLALGLSGRLLQRIRRSWLHGSLSEDRNFLMITSVLTGIVWGMIIYAYLTQSAAPSNPFGI